MTEVDHLGGAVQHETSHGRVTRNAARSLVTHRTRTRDFALRQEVVDRLRVGGSSERAPRLVPHQFDPGNVVHPTFLLQAPDRLRTDLHERVGVTLRQRARRFDAVFGIGPVVGVERPRAQSAPRRDRANH